jgi:anthranilate phosphoribosyltransferase
MSTKEQFEKLFNNQLSEQEAKDLLVGLYQKGESASDIAAAASVMREHSIKLELSDELRAKAIDIVGTGGDKSGSFNISTTVSLLLSSMGCVVAKHGNRSITSKSGSADLLEALGINLNLSTTAQLQMLQDVGFAFIFAINHHPAMKHIMPIRKSLTHRTIFNILGPLTNPSDATKYLLGVFDPAYIDKMAQALVELGASKAFVVSSYDGMDEISISTRSAFAYVSEGKVLEGEINPELYGLSLAPKEDILGGDANYNAQITLDILSGKEKGAKRDIVLLNGAFALFCDGKARDIKEAIEMLQAQLDSGKAYLHLQEIIKLSNSFDEA